MNERMPSRNMLEQSFGSSSCGIRPSFIYPPIFPLQLPFTLLARPFNLPPYLPFDPPALHNQP